MIHANKSYREDNKLEMSNFSDDQVPQHPANPRVKTTSTSFDEMELIEIRNRKNSRGRTHGHELDERSHNYAHCVIRLAAAVTLLILGWYFGRGLGKIKIQSSHPCMKDIGFQLLEKSNQFIHKSPIIRKGLQITSSMIMDLTFVNILFCFFKHGKSGFIIYVIAVFYLSRAALQTVFKFRYPEGMLWDYPGFPSLTVPYGITSDFYFSGHCGFLAANALVTYTLGRKITSICLFLCVGYLAYVLVLFRVHYTIDIPIGILFGLWSVFAARWLTPYFDKIFKVLFFAKLVHKIVTMKDRNDLYQGEGRLRKSSDAKKHKTSLEFDEVSYTD